MKVQVVAFGIARDILESTMKEISLDEGNRIVDLKERLVTDYPAFAELRSLRFAVNEEYQSDEYMLSPKDEVVIIPPVSGG